MAAAAGPQMGKIVMIGGSITRGAGYAVAPEAFPQNGSRAWRWEFFKSLVDASADFDFVGSLSTDYTNSAARDDSTNSHS